MSLKSRTTPDCISTECTGISSGSQEKAEEFLSRLENFPHEDKLSENDRLQKAILEDQIKVFVVGYDYR